MKSDKIKKILPFGEGQNIEYKSSCKNIREIGQIVCGFLNTSSGGYIVCNLEGKGKIIDVEPPEHLVKRIEQDLEKGLSPKALVSVQIQIIEGHRLIVIEVPSGKDFPYSFQNVIYLRDSLTTKIADVGAISELVLRKQVEPERWERRFSPADIERDLDNNELNSTVQDVQKTERLQFRSYESAIMILEDLSVSKYGRLTNGGDVLFTANPAIRHPQIRVRAVFLSADKTDTKFRDMQTFEGPLVQLLRDVRRFIQRNTSTISHFETGDLKRKDNPLYPPAAIREGLINAFAHRDYSNSSGGVLVSIFPKQLEISNTGKFPDGVVWKYWNNPTSEERSVGNISVLRNPDIAHVLYLRGFMEKIGRGNVMIRDSCAEYGLPPPQWSEDDQGVTLTFFAPTQEVTRDVTREVTRDVTRDVTRMLKVFDGDMSRRNLQDLLQLKDEEHFRTAYLQPALQDGLIEMTIPDKPKSSKQKYRLTNRGRSLIEKK
jgi:ATP-dependent DNA helicase RecG